MPEQGHKNDYWNWHAQQPQKNSAETVFLASILVRQGKAERHKKFLQSDSFDGRVVSVP
jgi:hypothetical protein